MGSGTIVNTVYHSPAIDREAVSETMVINSLNNKSTIQGYYYLRDLNVKIASSKYPNFLMTTLLKCLFNVQWVPGPKP